MNCLIPLDGPTTVIELAGSRFLVDPTFDTAQKYPIGRTVLVKTTGSTWTPEQVERVDAVLLSHDQHPDNLDHAGRVFVERAPLTLTTPSAAGRVTGNTIGLQTWESHRVGSVTVTAVPALHGPEGADRILGPVTGFVLSASQAPTVYVSGDNASLDRVREIADRFPDIAVAVLFAGGGRTPSVEGYNTLSNEGAIEAVRILGCSRVLAMHTDGWTHFTQNGVSLRAAFHAASLDHLLIPATPGRATAI